jgi:hypothetical protein
MHALGIIVLMVLLVAIFVGGGDVSARLGRVVYGGASGVAMLLALLAIFEFTRADPDGPFLGLIFGAIGIGVWLAGRAVVYVLAGR